MNDRKEDTMKNKKSIATVVVIAAVAVLSYALIGGQNEGVSANEKSKESESFFSRLVSPLTTETATVPAGTQIQVRLEQGISTEKNSSGDQFRASLDNPLTVDGKTVAPAGSQVVGELSDVQEPGRVKGRAKLTMTLRQITVDGEEYDLDVKPLTLIAESTKKRDAGSIAGGAAVGAVIGAIAGGGKGAAIGAASGGGAGTGFVLATKGKELKYNPEAQFAFTLSSSLKLPVVNDKG
jgi:hypothetical protein